MVVFEAGGFAWSTDWGPVIDALGPAVPTLAYDRAGLGWSDPGPAPRDLDHQLADLRALLGAVGASPPYILVGASYGGHIVRAYADLYPEEVRGLVLVDARHPAVSQRLPEGWRRYERAAVLVSRVLAWAAKLGLLPLLGRLLGERMSPPAAKTLPPERRERYLAECFGPSAWRTSIAEAEAIDASDARAARVTEHGDLPLIVLRHGEPDLFRPLGSAATEAEKAWVSLQEALARTSTRGQLRVVPGAGHAISLQHPEAVAAAIRDVLAAGATRPR